MITRNFDERQNAHTSAQNLCYVTTIAYSVWLDLLSSTFLGFMIYTFIPLKSAGLMGGDVGLALTQFLSVSSVLQLAMRRFAELISYITALERMFEYTKLEQEGPFETEFDKKHDTLWPSRGEIKFEHLNLRYSDEEGPVLKNLNFIIKPNMKVRAISSMAVRLINKAIYFCINVGRSGWTNWCRKIFTDSSSLQVGKI